MLHYIVANNADVAELMRQAIAFSYNQETGHRPDKKDRLAHDAIADALSDAQANVACPG